MRILLMALVLAFLSSQADLYGQTSIRLGSKGRTPSVANELRTWRNLEGRSIKARLREYDGVTAKLDLGGRIYVLRKETLSAQDRSYLDAWLSRQPGTLATDKMPSLTDAHLATAPQLDLRAVEKMVHEVVNRERLKRKIRQLAWNDQVAGIARAHSEDMATRDFFSHLNPEGEDPTARAVRQGWTASKGVSSGDRVTGLTENVGRVGRYRSFRREVKDGKVSRLIFRWHRADQLAEQIVNGWLNSPNHRDNLLDPERELEGIGLGVRREHIFVTQNLF